LQDKLTKICKDYEIDEDARVLIIKAKLDKRILGDGFTM
jgi:hypothetical protein